MRVGRVGCATEPGRPQLCLQLGLQQLRPAVEEPRAGAGLCVACAPAHTHVRAGVGVELGSTSHCCLLST